MSLIGIINLGLGNFASIQRMINKTGGGSILINEPNQLLDVSKVVLPGVGHFDEGMKQMNNRGFADPLKKLISNNDVLVLGICLGMQLLCRTSEEGEELGLGLIDANVKKFTKKSNANLKIPHMGWNSVKSIQPNLLLTEMPEEQRFYFVHSFKVVPNDNSIAIGSTDYNGLFCSAFQKKNLFGVQFHPEKSHKFGMNLMKRFVEL